MITNIGKSILSKYLIGQTTSYASHIAVGCGATPGLSGSSYYNEDYSNKKNLDFEVARVPISSRGYQLIDGVENIVFTAQLPSASEYDITEIGVFSAAKDPTAVGSDSRTILSFTPEEQWEIHDSYSSAAVEHIEYPLDSFSFTISNAQVFGNTINIDIFVPQIFPYGRSLKINSKLFLSHPDQPSYNLSGFVTNFPVALVPGSSATVTMLPLGPLPQEPFVLSMINVPNLYAEFSDGIFASQLEKRAFFVSNNNSYFSPNGSRKPEKPRVSSASLMLRGDSVLDNFDTSAGILYHLHLNNFSIDLSKNLPTDELRLAFCITDTTNSASALPITSVTFKIEFGNSEASANRQYARFIGFPQQTSPGHYVVSAQIQNLETTSNFSWSEVNTVRIAATIEGGSQVGDSMSGTVTAGYIVFDSLRVESTSSINPLYGLTGYSVVKTPSGNPIPKTLNTTSLVEFRFALDVSNNTGM